MIIYLILVHKCPVQLRRLIDRLNFKHAFFIIHVDKKSGINPFKNLVSEAHNIQYVADEEREAVRWGDISTIRATLILLGKALKTGLDGYCILLSGQDYPLKSNDYIYSDLRQTNGKQFINTFPLPSDKWPNKGLDRLFNYKINFSEGRGDFFIVPFIS